MRERLQVGTETRSTLQILTPFQALMCMVSPLGVLVRKVPLTPLILSQSVVTCDQMFHVPGRD